jgi:hypothetical protein
MIINPRQIPIVDLGLMQRAKVDGLLDHIHIIGDEFVRTYYRLTTDGSSALVRAPFLEVRQTMRFYEPGQIKFLMIEEQARLARGRRLLNGTRHVAH